MANLIDEKKKTSTTTQQPVDYSQAMWTTDPSKAYAGLADYLTSLQPKTNPTKENELKRMAKTSAWIDLGKTLMEGLAMTLGQNTGNGAMPNAAPRGTNPMVVNSVNALDKIKENYQNQQNFYNQQLLAQKLREIQYGIDQDKYNTGVKLQEIKDNRTAAENETEWQRKWALFNAEQDAKNKETAKVEAAKRFAVADHNSGDGNVDLVPFNNNGQEYVFYNHLFRKYPEWAKLSTDAQKIVDGQITTLEGMDSKSLEQLRELMSRLPMDKEDVNAALTITGKPLKYDPKLIQAEQQAKQVRDNIYGNVRQVSTFPQFFDPTGWQKQPQTNYVEQNNIAEQPTKDWSQYKSKRKTN